MDSATSSVARSGSPHNPRPTFAGSQPLDRAGHGYPSPVTSTEPTRRAAPAPLVVAAGLAGVQGVLMLAYAVLEIASTPATRLAMGATTSAFFALYGLALLLCAWRLLRLESWARSPVVLAQLIHLGLAWSFWGGSTRAVSVALAVAAVVVIAGILHPASIAAVEAHEAD